MNPNEMSPLVPQTTHLKITKMSDCTMQYNISVVASLI